MVAVDTSWNIQYNYNNFLHENLDYMPRMRVLNCLEPIKKTYFSPAENIDFLFFF